MAKLQHPVPIRRPALDIVAPCRRSSVTTLGAPTSGTLVDAATLIAEDGRSNPVAALLRQALRYMEEPVMLAEAITEWRQEAIAEGRTEGLREGTSQGRRTLLRRQAIRRYGVEAGDEFGRLLAQEEDADRLELAGDLVIDCSSAEELLRRGRRLLDGNGAP